MYTDFYGMSRIKSESCVLTEWCWKCHRSSLLNETKIFHLNQCCDTKIVTELKQKLRVDDWLTGAYFQDEDADMVTKAVTVMG